MWATDKQWAIINQCLSHGFIHVASKLWVRIFFFFCSVVVGRDNLVLRRVCLVNTNAGMSWDFSQKVVFHDGGKKFGKLWFTPYFISCNCFFELFWHSPIFSFSLLFWFLLHFLQEFFENPAFRPDGLKLYPTLVIRGTGLYELWKTGRYKSYSPSALVDLVARILALVPPWTRVYRVQRWRDTQRRLLELSFILED